MFEYKSWCALAVVLSVSPVLLSGCSSATGAPTEEPTGKTGKLSAALSTTGADGATYTFPPNTVLSVLGTAFGQGFFIDGSETVFTQSLPVDTYTIQLNFPTGTEPSLVRTDATGTTTVAATWLDVQPVTVVVSDNATSDVTLHFSVAGLGDVTFQSGKLQVQLDVAQSGTQSSRFEEDGPLNFFFQDFADSTAAYVAPLSVDLEVDQQESLQLALSGDWVFQSAGNVCKTATVQGLGFTSSSLGNRMLELSGAVGSVCISDQGANDQLNFFVTRRGPAPADQQAFLPDESYTFYIIGDGFVGDVFDGHTLHEGAFRSPVGITNGTFFHYVYNADTTVLLTQAIAHINGLFQLVP